MPDFSKPWLTFLAVLAGIGLILSFLSHVAALSGAQGPLGTRTFWLHIGVFIVWIPTVLVSKRMTAGFDQKDFWKAVLRGCPSWARYVVGGFFAYALVNFILALTNAPPKGSGPGGMPPSVVRGFSGHWMAFYSAAMAVLYSAAHVPELRPRTCSNGHAVGPQAQFCENCGQPVAAPLSGLAK
ncbi:MAG TPA: hypothetical protein VGN17_07135 [Bryobacteraceae bacterium]|jgi:hypothetical protein